MLVFTKVLPEWLHGLSRVSYREWMLRVESDADGRWFLQWQFVAPCSRTGVTGHHSSRKWFLSEHMTEGELVQTALAAALQAEEHECREFFRYRGKAIFGPHIAVQALLQVCDQLEGRLP